MLSEWESWSSCSVDCVNTRTYNFPQRTRIRKKIRSAVGSGLCLHLYEKENSCPNLPKCPINGEWTEWSKSVGCDKLCGEGIEIHTRTCEGQLYGGDTCHGESEKEEPCFLRDCFCNLSEWSGWSSCVAIQNGCGNGKKMRERMKNDTNINCSLRNGDLLEEEKDCFTKHCTNEFYTLNKITIDVIEGEYPGTSKEWKMTVQDSDGNDLCTTSTISGLDRGLRKSITGHDLGECGTSRKKLNLEDFKDMKSIKLQIRPDKEDNGMTITKVDIFNCDDNFGGSGNKWSILIKGICTMNGISDFYYGQWKKINTKKWLGECFTKKIDNLSSSLYIDFKSDGTDDMALCLGLIKTSGNFKSYEYFHNRTGKNNIWTNDDGGKNSEFIGWGPLKRRNHVKTNKIKIGSVQLDFCGSDCDNGIAEYKSNTLPDVFHNMVDGLEVSLDLQDQRKFCCTVIDLQAERRKLPRRFKKLAGIFRLKTKNAHNWVFKHDEGRYVIKR